VKTIRPGKKTIRLALEFVSLWINLVIFKAKDS